MTVTVTNSGSDCTFVPVQIAFRSCLLPRKNTKSNSRIDWSKPANVLMTVSNEAPIRLTGRAFVVVVVEAVDSATGVDSHI